MSAKLYPPQAPVRQADGLHVLVRISGRAAVTFGGMPYVPLPSYSCPGFDICTANADNTSGPVSVTEGREASRALAAGGLPDRARRRRLQRQR